MPAQSDAKGGEMRQRIDHLEGLVKKLIEERQPVSLPVINPVHPAELSKPKAELSTSAVSSGAQNEAGTGKTVMDGVHSIYLGDDDWHAVLQEVTCDLYFFFQPLSH